jgi:alcohol dehydrogenase class IV
MAKSGCDVLISIGGGSPIDSAKAIAYNIHQETGKWIPSIAVPTTLSVAETTQNAGFTTEEKHKIAVSDPELVPKGMIAACCIFCKLMRCQLLYTTAISPYTHHYTSGRALG